MLNEAVNRIILPVMDELIKAIYHMAEANAQIPMLSRTHGQVIELSLCMEIRTIYLTGRTLILIFLTLPIFGQERKKCSFRPVISLLY